MLLCSGKTGTDKGVSMFIFIDPKFRRVFTVLTVVVCVGLACLLGWMIWEKTHEVVLAEQMGFLVRNLDDELDRVSTLPDLQGGTIVTGYISYDGKGGTRVFKEYVKFRIDIFSGNKKLGSEEFVIMLKKPWRPDDPERHRFTVPVKVPRHQGTYFQLYFIEGS